MNINVFLLCFNESAILPHTINHYKKYLPSCKITVYDNESVDNSVEIAIALGCTVISWNSNNIHDEYLQVNLRNNIWKNCLDGWIIMADMDEFVCVTEEDLIQEMNYGVTILNIKGYDMIGESNTLNLTDINLQDIQKYTENTFLHKHLCFLRPSIVDMNYGPGSHSCIPQGNVVYSSNVYMMKHMCLLGLPFFTNKLTERYKRNEKMRKKGLNYHYIQDTAQIELMYRSSLDNCNFLD